MYQLITLIIEGYFMKLLGSIVYVTSAFYNFFRGGLLSTLDSLLFCIFMITQVSFIFKMGYSIRIDIKCYGN